MIVRQLEINEDIEHTVSKHAKKKTKGNFNKMLALILQQWQEKEDKELFEKNSKSKTENKLPDVGDADLDCISLKDLKEYVDHWIELHGEDAILQNYTPYNIGYEIEQ